MNQSSRSGLELKAPTVHRTGGTLRRAIIVSCTSLVDGACRSAVVSATCGPTSRGNCAIPYTDELIIKVIDTWGEVRRFSGKVISFALMQLGSWRSLVLAANLWQKVCLCNSALLGTIGLANADLRK